MIVRAQGFNSDSEDDHSDDEGDHVEGMSGDEQMGEQEDFEGSDGFDEVCCSIFTNCSVVSTAKGSVLLYQLRREVFCCINCEEKLASGEDALHAPDALQSTL